VKNNLFQTIAIFIGLFLIFKFTGSLLYLINSGKQVKAVEERILKLERERREIFQKYQYYQSDEFVEEEARNKLNMSKPGETIVILPPSPTTFLNQPGEKTNLPLPNWKKWWNLFF